jgi:hypothetical protein
MNKDHACSTLQRFFCVVIIGAVLAFAKADAQESTPVKNETSHLQAQFNVVDIQIGQYLELEITTSDSDRVSLVSSQNGEYKNAVVLSSEIRNDSLLITDPFNPTFSFPQDKLSAHKIIDGKATLSLPRNKHLVINTQTADITITGNYKSIYINQLSGSCKIDQLAGDLRYVSVYASIYVDLKNYDIRAVSRSGNVFNFEKPSLINYFARLESISGNISNLKKRNK